MPARLTDAKRAAIWADVVRGLSRRAICERHHVSATTVSRIESADAGDDFDRECNMTEDELEALIAEQLPTMPQRDESREQRLPQAVSRGIGLRATQRYGHRAG